MRALTVKQPWAAAIAHGPKRIENRARPIPAKHLGTTILIHAGVSEDVNALPADMVQDWPRHWGAIVAVADLTSCHQAARSPRCCAPWGFPEAWHWQLGNVRAVPHPILGVRGQLGLWTVPADVLAAVQRQVHLPQEVAS
ncbi:MULTISPECIES: ASCH domain-containing protein [unclassified Streptomyces]|uniref:ASCH domain-containing protein n=1 Tax=unclassified Streptomyces TaxID=2593676 RepID=UPI001F397CB4|nr:MULTISPECIES: ASCH domain-containing protein [unclassified Streptomyces]MCF0086681.1 hypothetical protein [Streptomyces sp. MH192]MCF0098835.1 hypothetical protein [Streptomyces sp. MH191]